MKKIYKTILILVSLIILLILYLINSEYIIKSFLEYSKLFYTKLFPVSLIFFIFSTLLIEYKILDIIPININSIYIYLLSLISGFPSGSKYIRELLDNNYISHEEASSLILFSHFPNPLFILGSINLIINNKTICFKILLSIILSNFIILLFTKKYKKKHHNTLYPNNFSKILKKSIYTSIKTILLIYGTSIFFYLISSIITKYISFNPYLYILISGIFDLTKGVFSTSIINNTIIKSLFILIFISFGSISIHIQVKSILEDTLLYKSFIKGRIIGTILTIIIFLLLISPIRC
ncbi:MAG: hypothetical protein IK137_00795 [Bacilli bacterium]|nr:hypothetical protein [Bacilli bacterium]